LRLRSFVDLELRQQGSYYATGSSLVMSSSVSRFSFSFLVSRFSNLCPSSMSVNVRQRRPGRWRIGMIPTQWTGWLENPGPVSAVGWSSGVMDDGAVTSTLRPLLQTRQQTRSTPATQQAKPRPDVPKTCIRGGWIPNRRAAQEIWSSIGIEACSMATSTRRRVAISSGVICDMGVLCLQMERSSSSEGVITRLV
jgi:hypothetical protein